MLHAKAVHKWAFHRLFEYVTYSPRLEDVGRPESVSSSSATENRSRPRRFVRPISDAPADATTGSGMGTSLVSNLPWELLSFP